MDPMNLRGVDRFYLVQSSGLEASAITDEKEYKDLREAVRMMRESEAPVKYLKFNYRGFTYKLYPVDDSDEYEVIQEPILN